MPFVYILICRDGTLYTGAAKDLAARLRQHECGRASRYTRARLPVRLAWSRRVRTWSAALQQEYRIKQLPRVAKEELLAATRSRFRPAPPQTRCQTEAAATASGRSATSSASRPAALVRRRATKPAARVAAMARRPSITTTAARPASLVGPRQTKQAARRAGGSSRA